MRVAELRVALAERGLDTAGRTYEMEERLARDVAECGGDPSELERDEGVFDLLTSLGCLSAEETTQYAEALSANGFTTVAVLRLASKEDLVTIGLKLGHALAVLHAVSGDAQDADGGDGGDGGGGDGAVAAAAAGGGSGEEEEEDEVLEEQAVAERPLDIGDRCAAAHERHKNVMLRKRGFVLHQCDGDRITNGEEVTVLGFTADRELTEIRADDWRVGWMRTKYLSRKDVNQVVEKPDTSANRLTSAAAAVAAAAASSSSATSKRARDVEEDSESGRSGKSKKHKKHKKKSEKKKAKSERKAAADAAETHQLKLDKERRRQTRLGSKTISISVRGDDDVRIYFKLKRDQAFKKMMDFYAKR